MNMDNLRHLQLVILGIMKDIDRLCRENDIEYYLLGGSAIGAIRHQGFIPWDDDLDIIMTPDNYRKFLEVCRKQLDSEKYYMMEGLKDWPLNFTKIKLKGTHLKEIGGVFDMNHDGIYLDVFKLENAPSGKLSQTFQYVLAKYFLCFQLSVRTFEGVDTKKRMMMLASFPLRLKFIRNIVRHFIEGFGDCTSYYGSFYFRTRLKTAFTRKEVFGKPVYKMFEGMMLPVPEKWDEYLTQMFGDYMTPPAVEKRVGLHLIDVDFGCY